MYSLSFFVGVCDTYVLYVLPQEGLEKSQREICIFGKKEREIVLSSFDGPVGRRFYFRAFSLSLGIGNRKS
jgi:hypothetical protein